MNAQTLLRSNGAKAGELVETVSAAAGSVAKAIEGTAGPLAELIEAKAGTLAKSVEVRATPLAEAVGSTVEALAKSVEERAGPLAEAFGEKVDVLAEDLEEQLEQARKDIAAGVQNFKFGQREALFLGLAVGVLAAAWLVRRIDRQAAAARLRAAGARFGEVRQDLTSRAGEATQGLAGKAATFAEQAGDRVGQVVQDVGTRAGEAVQSVRGQEDQAVEDAKQRLSGVAAGAGGVMSDQAQKAEEIGSGLDEATREAIDEVVENAEQIRQEVQDQVQELGLSNGMKVVAFDGTDIGRVQEIREGVFVLDRPKGNDLLVPLSEVARIEGTVAYLRIDVGQVMKQGWEEA